MSGKVLHVHTQQTLELCGRRLVNRPPAPDPGWVKSGILGWQVLLQALWLLPGGLRPILRGASHPPKLWGHG